MGASSRLGCKNEKQRKRHKKTRGSRNRAEGNRWGFLRKEGRNGKHWMTCHLYASLSSASINGESKHNRPGSRKIA